MPGIIFHGAHLGRGTKRIGDTLRRPFVIGRESDADMAVVGARALSICFNSLVAERAHDGRKSSASSDYVTRWQCHEGEPATTVVVACAAQRYEFTMDHCPR